jgi:hypothetical protein
VHEVDRIGAALLEVLDHDQQRVALALGGEEPLERHEQAGLEALRRPEDRRDDRAVLERHAQEVGDQVRDLGQALGVDDLGELDAELVAAHLRVLAGDEPEPRGQRARDRAIGVGVLVGDTVEQPGRRVLGADPRHQLVDEAGLAHAGLADHDGEPDVAAAERLRGQRVELAQRGGAADEPRPQLVGRVREDRADALGVEVGRLEGLRRIEDLRRADRDVPAAGGGADVVELVAAISAAIPAAVPAAVATEVSTAISAARWGRCAWA